MRCLLISPLVTGESFQLSEGQVAWRLAQLEKRLDELEHDAERKFEALNRKVDRLTWALVTLSLSITSAAVIFALTVFTVR